MCSKKFGILLLVFVILFAFTAPGCGYPQEEPAAVEGKAEDRVETEEDGELVVEDFAGRELALEKPPQNFVSAMPSNTEILFALGLGDRVLGVTDFCDYPPETQEKDTIGDSYNIDVEKVVELDPHLIFTGGGQEDLSNTLTNLDIPAVVINPNDFESIQQSILLIGKISGTKDKAESFVKDMQDRAEEITSLVDEIPPEEKPEVLVLVDPESLYTTGRGTFINELIEMAGGTNIITKSGYLTISEEKIIEENPDIIINTFPMREEVLERSGWEVITAVEKGEVYDIDGNLVSRPGPRILEGLEQIFEILHANNKDT